LAYKTNRQLRDSLPRTVTIKALAERLDMDRTTLSMRLNTGDAPDPEFAERILKAAGEIEREVAK